MSAALAAAAKRVAHAAGKAPKGADDGRPGVHHRDFDRVRVYPRPGGGRGVVVEATDGHRLARVVLDGDELDEAFDLDPRAAARGEIALHDVPTAERLPWPYVAPLVDDAVAALAGGPAGWRVTVDASALQAALKAAGDRREAVAAARGDREAARVALAAARAAKKAAVKAAGDHRHRQAARGVHDPLVKAAKTAYDAAKRAVVDAGLQIVAISVEADEQVLAVAAVAGVGGSAPSPDKRRLTATIDGPSVGAGGDRRIGVDAAYLRPMVRAAVARPPGGKAVREVVLAFSRELNPVAVGPAVGPAAVDDETPTFVGIVMPRRLD